MTSEELRKQAIAAYKAGRRAQARELLLKGLQMDRHNEQTWLWLSAVANTDAERRVCLEEVLVLNPANAAARRGLEHLGALEDKPSAGTQPEAPPRLKPISRIDAPPQPMFGAVPPPVAPEQPSAAGETKRDRADVSGWVFAGAIAVTVCVVACVLVLVLGSFGEQSPASPTDSPAQITSVVYENVAAHNAEDAGRYMATIHSQAPGRAQMRSMLEDVYRNYDMEYALAGVQLLKSSGTRAEVSFTLTTRKIRGPAFRDNVVVGVFILRKEDGRWKLYDQRVDDIEYLD